MKNILKKIKQRHSTFSIVMMALAFVAVISAAGLGRVYAEYSDEPETFEIVQEEPIQEIVIDDEGSVEVVEITDETENTELQAEASESDADEEDESETDEMEIVYIDDNTILLPKPVRKGYIFVGWCSSPDGDEDAVWYNAGDEYVISGEETLYAIWEKDTDEDGVADSQPSDAIESTASDATAANAESSEGSGASGSSEGVTAGEGESATEAVSEAASEVTTGENESAASTEEITAGEAVPSEASTEAVTEVTEAATSGTTEGQTENHAESSSEQPVQEAH